MSISGFVLVWIKGIEPELKGYILWGCFTGIFYFLTGFLIGPYPK